MSFSGPTFSVTQDAARTELRHLGAIDQMIKKGECVSYWRRRINKCTNFAMENNCQAFASAPEFGGSSYANLQHSAHLMYYLTLVMQVPAIKAYVPPENASADSYTSSVATPADNAAASGDWAHWANSVAVLLVKSAQLILGGNVTDTVYSISMYMWEELSGRAGKRLTEMIGKRRSRDDLLRDAQRPQRFYLPLPYSFTLNPGNVLPLENIAKSGQGVSISVAWEKLENCVVVSRPGVQVLKADNTPLCNSDLKAWIDCTYVHLDYEEQMRFKQSNFDQLITQTQIHYTLGRKSESHTFPLHFSNPVMDMTWVIRRKVYEACNNWFNFSGHGGRDPMEDVTLLINGKCRFGGHEGRYYRLVEPYQSRNNIPEAHIYHKSFCISGEDPNPNGSNHFSLSAHGTAQMIIRLQPELADEDVSIIVIARSHQILRFNKEHVGPLFPI